MGKIDRNQMWEKFIELHKSGNSYKKIAMFILHSRTVRRMIRGKKFPKDDCWRITEGSSILGSSSLQNYLAIKTIRRDFHANKLFGRYAILWYVILPQT